MNKREAKRARNGLPSFSEPGLSELHFHLRGGLARFVPATEDLGAPAFNQYGKTIHRDDDTTPGFLLVRLRITNAKEEWHAVLGVYDGDDLCLQVWRPLTWVYWRILRDLWELVCAGIDASVLKHLYDDWGAG